MRRFITSIVEIVTGVVCGPFFELRDMERICLEQARLCGLPESQAALEEMARNYRAAIDGRD